MDLPQVCETFRKLARAHQVPGAQLAVLHHGDTWAFEHGERRYRGGEALTGETKVPIGSITQTFAATPAMVLVSDGDLELDAPVAEYLPEVRRRAHDLAARLTPRHLLSHSGGLAAECVRPATRDSILRLDTLPRPGVGFSYSHLGYALARQVIEALTGMTWWQAMEAIVLKPLQITPGFVAAPHPIPSGPPGATGHAVNRALRRTRPVEQVLDPVEASAGGLAMSATDLVTLGRLLLRPEHGGIAEDLVAEDLTLMWRAVPVAEPLGLADGWALGLALFRPVPPGGWDTTARRRAPAVTCASTPRAARSSRSPPMRAPAPPCGRSLWGACDPRAWMSATTPRRSAWHPEYPRPATARAATSTEISSTR